MKNYYPKQLRGYSIQPNKSFSEAACVLHIICFTVPV